jgi:CRP-like cAMP-binding protein
MVTELGQVRGENEWDYGRLRGFNAFSDLDDEVIASVAQKCTYYRVMPQCEVIARDDFASGIYMLLSGSITYSIESTDSQSRTVGCAQSPRYFGLVGLLKSGVHESSVTSSTEADGVSDDRLREQDKRRDNNGK